ncbi:hypothetical protein G113_10349 [Aeromonas molluscorum 848]|uniref:Uncharacterized protein n=1 Tax=Aeromonas molluscorum 848 TaxID=1268236 RepID=R1H9S6_9GAMM|nr:hypothetical protein G113_10349 [Aeromonas molluscorum 848]
MRVPVRMLASCPISPAEQMKLPPKNEAQGHEDVGLYKRCYGIATLIAENQKASLLNWRQG